MRERGGGIVKALAVCVKGGWTPLVWVSGHQRRSPSIDRG